MLLLAGTVPSDVGQIIEGKASYDDKESIRIGARRLPVSRGTASLVGAAVATSRYSGLESPYVIMAGDIGQKTSGAIIYETVQDFIEKNPVKVLVLSAFPFDQGLSGLVFILIPSAGRLHEYIDKRKI